MGSASASGTSRPGHPYHWNFVALERPLSPVTSPPDDMEKLYWPSSERLMVMGRRLEMRSRRPLEADVSWSVVVILPGRTRGARCRVYVYRTEEGMMRCDAAWSWLAVAVLWCSCSTVRRDAIDAPGKDLEDQEGWLSWRREGPGRQLRVSGQSNRVCCEDGPRERKPKQVCRPVCIWTMTG